MKKNSRAAYTLRFPAQTDRRKGNNNNIGDAECSVLGKERHGGLSDCAGERGDEKKRDECICARGEKFPSSVICPNRRDGGRCYVNAFVEKIFWENRVSASSLRPAPPLSFLPSLRAEGTERGNFRFASAKPRHKNCRQKSAVKKLEGGEARPQQEQRKGERE